MPVRVIRATVDRVDPDPVVGHDVVPWCRRVPPPRGAPKEFVTMFGAPTGHAASGITRPPVVREMLNSLAISSRDSWS